MSQLAWAALVAMCAGFVFMLWERMPSPFEDQHRRAIGLTLLVVGALLFLVDSALR